VQQRRRPDIFGRRKPRRLLVRVWREESALRSFCLRKTRIERGERYVERLCESNIPTVVDRHVVPKLPDSLRERFESVELYVEFYEILESSVRFLLSDPFASLEAANHICYFDRKMSRRV